MLLLSLSLRLFYSLSFIYRPIRLFYIPYLLDRWKGHYCIVMYCKLREVKSAIQEYLSFSPSSRITILFYSFYPDNMYANDFPVNLLRNVGIRQVETSHFVMLDMDMWVNGMILFISLVDSFSIFL